MQTFKKYYEIINEVVTLTPSELVKPNGMTGEVRTQIMNQRSCPQP